MGILQTDSVLEKFQPEFGDYPQMFAQLLQQAAAAVQPPVDLQIRVYPAHEGALPQAPAECDGYLITGSRHSVYDDLPWIGELAGFLGRVFEAGGKVIGICFGHQLLAHYFGGETRAAEVGWRVGVWSAEVVSHEPWMQPPLDGFRLLSSHKDQVSRLPDGAQLIASSETCPVSGFLLGRQAFTLQGHPEFRKPYARALMTFRRELLGEDVFRAGIQSLERETQEGVIAQWIVNFIRQD